MTTGMIRFGLVKIAVAAIYEEVNTAMVTQFDIMSAISDEGLYGTAVAVTGGMTGMGHRHEIGDAEFVSVRTFYGYSGFMRAVDLLVLDEAEVIAWEASDLMVVSGFCVDVMSSPKVQSVRLISLYRGALVQVMQFESEKEGWAKVRLVDGSIGYIRNQFLWKKEFSQSGVWTKELPQRIPVDEKIFRGAVVNTACTYLGTQYRWGGRSTAGIDCSGLTSISYMMHGVLIYRDANIAEEYPVHEISMERIKAGDLLYFPGHIAMYIGEGTYIHATGKIGSGGVVINSLNPCHKNYREDLVKSLYAVGSIY